MRTAHSSPYGGLPDRDPLHWTETSLNRDPIPRTETQTPSPGQKPSLYRDLPGHRSSPPLLEGIWDQEQRPPLLEETWHQATRQEVTSYRDRPPPPVDRQKSVKILPCPKLPLREVINVFKIEESLCGPS